jgi:hypothetical protein
MDSKFMPMILFAAPGQNIMTFGTTLVAPLEPWLITSRLFNLIIRF